MQRYCTIGRPRILLTTSVVAAFLGCGRSPTAPPADKPLAGVSLRVLAGDTLGRLLLERHGRVWERQSGARVQAVDTGPADVIFFNPARMGDLLAASKLAALPEELTASGYWAGFTRPFRNRLLLWGDAAYALPLVGDATFVIYRADLFAAAGRRPPATFAEFSELAKLFGSERRRPALPPLADDARLDREFHAAAAGFAVRPVLEGTKADAAAFAFQFDVETAAPRIAGPGFVAALEWLHDLQPVRSRRPTATEAWAADDAVLGLGTLNDLAALKPAEYPGRFGVAPIPAGPTGERVPFVGPGGLLGAVTRESSHAAAAIDLLHYLSGPPVSLEVVHDPAFGSAPFRRSHLSERQAGWFGYGLGAPATDRLMNALAVAADPRVVNAPSPLRIPRAAEYRQSLLDSVRQVLAGQVAPREALEKLAAKWTELGAGQPATERLRDYLQSLCLRR